MHLERPQCVAVVRRDEHDRREMRRRDSRDDVEPVEAGNLNVEKDQVGLERDNRVDCRLPVLRFAYNLNVFLATKPNAQPLARERLVVDEHRSNDAAHWVAISGSARTCTAGGAARYGIVTDTRAPPPGASPISTSDASPYSCARRARVFARPIPPIPPDSEWAPFEPSLVAGVPGLTGRPLAPAAARNPGPVSATSRRKTPLWREARRRSSPGPATGDIPCTIAFSASGWRIMIGTSALSASSSTARVTVSRSPKRMRWISR